MPTKYANPTPEQLAARTRAREWARRQRDKELAARNQGAGTCQRRTSASTVCGTPFAFVRDPRTGTVSASCPSCARRAAGICQDCPRPVQGRVGHALRCAACKVVKRREHTRTYAQRHKEELSRRWSKRWATLDPEEKRQKLEAKRLWRRANPDKVRAYREKERETRAEAIREYHRRRRQEKKAEILEKARAYYYAHTPRPQVKPCRTCGADIKWAPPGRPKVRCDACVPPSVRARRRAEVPDYERPTIAAPARRCLTRGCHAVVNGRTKKCLACKQKQARTARMILSARKAA